MRKALQAHRKLQVTGLLLGLFAQTTSFAQSPSQAPSKNRPEASAAKDSWLDFSSIWKKVETLFSEGKDALSDLSSYFNIDPLLDLVAADDPDTLEAKDQKQEWEKELEGTLKQQGHSEEEARQLAQRYAEIYGQYQSAQAALPNDQKPSFSEWAQHSLSAEQLSSIDLNKMSNAVLSLGPSQELTSNSQEATTSGPSAAENLSALQDVQGVVRKMTNSDNLFIDEALLRKAAKEQKGAAGTLVAKAPTMEAPKTEPSRSVASSNTAVTSPKRLPEALAPAKPKEVIAPTSTPTRMPATDDQLRHVGEKEATPSPTPQPSAPAPQRTAEKPATSPIKPLELPKPATPTPVATTPKPTPSSTKPEGSKTLSPQPTPPAKSLFGKLIEANREEAPFTGAPNEPNPDSGFPSAISASLAPRPASSSASPSPSTSPSSPVKAGSSRAKPQTLTPEELARQEEKELTNQVLYELDARTIPWLSEFSASRGNSAKTCLEFRKRAQEPDSPFQRALDFHKKRIQGGEKLSKVEAAGLEALRKESCDAANAEWKKAFEGQPDEARTCYTIFAIETARIHTTLSDPFSFVNREEEAVARFPKMNDDEKLKFVRGYIQKDLQTHLEDITPSLVALPLFRPETEANFCELITNELDKNFTGIETKSEPKTNSNCQSAVAKGRSQGSRELPNAFSESHAIDRFVRMHKNLELASRFIEDTQGIKINVDTLLRKTMAAHKDRNKAISAATLAYELIYGQCSPFKLDKSSICKDLQAIISETPDTAQCDISTQICGALKQSFHRGIMASRQITKPDELKLSAYQQETLDHTDTQGFKAFIRSILENEQNEVCKIQQPGYVFEGTPATRETVVPEIHTER